jgi:branched-chain amino acid transport system substrate-binding protein
MSKKIKIVSLVVIILVIAIIVLIFTVKPEAKLSGEQIKIGYVGPLTGNAAGSGLVEKNVIEIATEEINSNGGIDGRKIKIIYEDGLCKGKNAANAAQKLINVDKVKIILSNCSSETLAIAPITEENKVILLTAYANHPDITYSGDYVFRTSHSDAITAQVAVQEMMKKHNQIGIIYELTPYAEALKNAINDEIKLLGGKIHEEMFLQDETDVRTQLAKLLANDLDAIFVNPDTSITGMAILKQLKELGFKGQVYGNFFGGSSDVLNESEANGMIFFAEPTIEENKIKAELFKKYKQHYNENPQYEYPAVSRYDDVYILKQAIEEVGYNPDLIRDYLYNMENFTGALGTYHFDANGDVVGIIPSVKQIIDGQVVIYQE